MLAQHISKIPIEPLFRAWGIESRWQLQITGNNSANLVVIGIGNGLEGITNYFVSDHVVSASYDACTVFRSGEDSRHRVQYIDERLLRAASRRTGAAANLQQTQQPCSISGKHVILNCKCNV